MTKKNGKMDKQRSTKHNTENQRLSNTTPAKTGVEDSGAPELRVIPGLSQEVISNFIHHLHIWNQNFRPKAHPSAKRSLA